LHIVEDKHWIAHKLCGAKIQ